MTIASNIRPVPKSTDLVITVAELKQNYLFGVNLTQDEGIEFPDDLFLNYILSAQSWFEAQIPGICLFPTPINAEAHDYYINDYVAYSFIKLFRYPVQDVSSVAVQFPLATNILKFDPSWYRVESVAAQVQLVPTQGTFSTILLSQGGSFLPLFYQGLQNVPSIFRVDYTAGFGKNQIPAQIKDIIGLKASIQPLNIAGDLIAGAGIASKSISMDGISQSITTTASAENTGYSANIKQREKEIDSRMKYLREYYTGIQMVMG